MAVLSEKAIISATVVASLSSKDHYGIPVCFVQPTNSDRHVQVIRPHLSGENIGLYIYRMDTMRIFLPLEDGNRTDAMKIFLPLEYNKFYVLEKISLITKKCFVDIGRKRWYLSATLKTVKELKDFVEATEYIQPKELYPQDISQLYKLNEMYENLYQRYISVILNILKGDRLIGYDIENFPDISKAVDVLDQEYDELHEQFDILKNQLDTYAKLKRELTTFGESYSSEHLRYEYRKF
jgi:hypothetical protein